MKIIARLCFLLLLALTPGTQVLAASVNGTKASNVNIPDATAGGPGAWVSSTIVISAAPAGATVTGIDVSFRCVHPYSGDLVIDLNADAQGNLGNRNLWNREGGAADNPARAVNNISTFNGVSVNRTWYLYARDYEAGDGGYIDEWDITIYYSAPPPAPSISSVSPPSMPGLNGDQNLTIDGSNFDPAATLTFDPPTGGDINSTEAKFTSKTSNRLIYRINNANDVGTWRVRVNNPGGTSSSWEGFEVTAPQPSISSVSPPSMPGINGDQNLTIDGGNFDPAATLTFDPPTGENINSTEAKFTSKTSNRLVYRINNANDIGIWRVRVNNPGGLTSDWQDFEVTGVSPTISSVSPPSMPGLNGNQNLTVDGSNFDPAATLTFDPPTGPNIESAEAKFVSKTSNRLVYQINNANDIGTWHVRVTNPGGLSSGWADFEVTRPAPSIGTVSPPSMPGLNGNQNITIDGDNFDPAATLTFDPPTGANIDSAEAKFVSKTSNRLVYQINNANDVGTWRVRVNNPNGQSSGWADFDVIMSGPSISSVSPTLMPGLNGNQNITIDGSNFDPVATLTFDPPTGANIDSAEAKFVSKTSTRLVYQINNANDVGTWHVRVNNPDGQSSGWADFDVTVPGPSISTVSPPSMPGLNGNQNITIDGGNFDPAATLIFDPPTGANIDSTEAKFISKSSTRLVYQINNANDVGAWRVRVNNPGGLFSGWADFNVTSQLILSVTPMFVPTRPATAGSISFSVNNSGSGAMSYSATITSGSSWLTITSGSSGGNSGTINVTYSANSGAHRSGTILITANGASGSPVNVTIAQSGATSSRSLRFDRNIYFIQHEANFGPFSDPIGQRAGLNTILDFIENDPALTPDANFTHLRWAAYILATTRAETGLAYMPVEERWDLNFHDVCSIRCDRGPHTATSQQDYFNFWYSGVNGNGDYDSGDGFRYRGRGYVQITGRGKYADLGTSLNLDLVNSPDLALDAANAYLIISYGMRAGAFTGYGLSDYITDAATDYVNARRIVNGVDRAEEIASAAAKFESILRASLIGVPRLAGSGGGGVQPPSGGQFALEVTGAPSEQIMIQVSSDLITWTDVQTVTITDGPMVFTDSNANQHAVRFYRPKPSVAASPGNVAKP